MMQNKKQNEALTEEEMIGFQMQGTESKESKLGEYYTWVSKPEEDKTIDDEVVKGFLSKDIKLGNLGNKNVMEIEAEIDMLEPIMRCLQPAGIDDPKKETQFVGQKAHLKANVSSGKHGFERSAQKTQVQRREVETTSNKDSGGLRSKISGVFR